MRPLPPRPNRARRIFRELLLTPGVGARTVQSLAMVAEIVHGAPYRFRDPARFSLAHGGKDRHPYPVPLKVFDETIRVMKSAVHRARLGRDEEMAGAEAFGRSGATAGADRHWAVVRGVCGGERGRSASLDGRSVFGWEAELAAADMALAA